MEIRKLSELKATNPYLRLGTDVSELEKSIQTVGLIAPIVISTDNVILAGARRFQALTNLGFTEAPVMIIDKGDLEKELVAIDENLVRKDLSKIEIEGHLRRAKEIYQALNPEEEKVEETQAEESAVKVEVLPAQKFLEQVSEKTGLSPKQIHEAITRDEKASKVVKEARKNGELSLSQTNEIVKLKPEEQEEAIEHIKELPVKEIKKFIKIAKVEGIDKAIVKTTQEPFAREYSDIEANLKKALKKLKQLELEGITQSDYPESLQKLIAEFSVSSYESHNDGYDSHEMMN